MDNIIARHEPIVNLAKRHGMSVSKLLASSLAHGLNLGIGSPVHSLYSRHLWHLLSCLMVKAIIRRISLMGKACFLAHRHTPDGQDLGDRKAVAAYTASREKRVRDSLPASARRSRRLRLEDFASSEKC